MMDRLRGHHRRRFRIPILVHDLIKKGYACLEERQVRESDRKVTRKYV